MGAQSLVNDDRSSNIHHDNYPHRGIDHGHSATHDGDGDDDSRSVHPITASDPCHSNCHQPLFISLFHLQLALFTIRNHLLSLWE